MKKGDLIKQNWTQLWIFDDESQNEYSTFKNDIFMYLYTKNNKIILYSLEYNKIFKFIFFDFNKSKNWFEKI